MNQASQQSNEHRSRLLWAGFMAILAAGAGFAIRGGIFDNWAQEYGFTGTQLGAIGGAGFIGFCFGIIFGGVIADKVGYGKLVVLAFACHVISALVTFGASTPDNAYQFLYWGMFLFAYANGTLEAVANPLVATLYPENRTHYLNILHASWPAGMVFGAVVGWYLDDKMQLGWKLQLALYLIPTVIYGVMFLGQKFPKSEASEKGVSLGQMFKDVGILGGLVVSLLLVMFFNISLGLPTFLSALLGGALVIAIGVITKFSLGSVLLFFLFIAHALVGSVELGTDGWIQNITGNLFTSEQGKILFIWTSSIMFVLRFCAEFIEKRLGISPVGLLLVCSILAVVGLLLSSVMTSFVVAFIALGIYATGKTFFWPTMLAVASDRFPRTGAVAISIMGGIGMMAAGLIGSQGLGYSKDYFSAQALKDNVSDEVYQEYLAAELSEWLVFETEAIDGAKMEAAKGVEEPSSIEIAVVAASQSGDRMTLRMDSLLPATMALIYLVMLLYFKGIGGYRAINIDEEEALEAKA